MLTKEKLCSLLMPDTITPSQREAVLCEEGPILVSASAGSGKTFVLATRVVYQLANPQTPLDPARLLVVTFTRAAAKEMRTRITMLFDRVISEFPTDRFLLRQRSLLLQAKIMTIDAFCAGLLREEFQRAKVSPDFRLIGEQELSLLQEEVMEELLEEEAVKQGDSFQEFCDYFSLRGDGSLRSILLRLYETSRTHPFPDSYLKGLLLPYREFSAWEDTPWANPLFQLVQEETARLEGLLERACLEAKSDPALLEKWDGFLGEYREVLGSFSKLFSRSWDEVVSFGRQMVFPSAPRRLKTDAYSRELADRIKNRYLVPVRERVRELQEKYLWTSSDALSCLQEQRPKMEQLVALTRRFSGKMRERMDQKNVLGFSDLTLKVIDLLFEESTGRKTPFGESFSHSFDAIFVDEFQDVNETQELLFSLLAGEDEKNLFLVGDVKQSIYRFRYANPGIFLRRRRQCQDPTKPGELFCLSENFRSRPEVTGSVNDLFSRLMTEEFGGIPYADSEQLVAAGRFFQADDRTTELVYLPASGGEEKEADYVASRIETMLQEGFSVSDGNRERPCQPGDFAILLRSGKEHAPVFQEALRRRGICARTDGTSGYFQAREVVLMLSLLQVIDNPALDLPMISILLSPLFSFTPDDVVKLRQLSPGGTFYECLLLSEDSKSICFLNTLRELRQAAAVLPASELIRKIYDETLFYSLFGACESSDRKLANLRLLLSYANEYESGQNGGLTGFLRFLEAAKETGKDFESANPTLGKESAVHILTIHKSKGLEFPVVFLSRCGNLMQFRELQGTAVFSARYGIALKHAYPKEFTQFSTIPYVVSQWSERRQMLEEELRILYVAMTRAREKLILTIASDPEKQSGSIPCTNNAGAFLHTLSGARSYTDWLTAVFIRHPQAVDLRKQVGVQPQTEAFSAPLSVRFADVEEQPEPEPVLAAKPDEEQLIKLKEALSFVYPFKALSKLPVKLSVTELTGIEEGRSYDLTIPNFSDELTAAQKGTINHAFLQFADFSAAESNLEEEIARMVTKEYLTAQEAKALDREGIVAFFRSSLYQRMKQATFLAREFSFLYELPVMELQNEISSSETVLIQGIADCVMQEGDHLVIIDYKTDRASSEELRRRYRAQLECYRRAISKTLELPVKELLLYSLFLQDTVSLED